MYAIVRSGGKQYKVAVGDELQLERIASEAGAAIDLGEVLMVADGEDLRVGTPIVAGAVVRATVLAQERGKKIIVFKYKAKKRYRKRAGHKQDLTRVKIEEIVV